MHGCDQTSPAAGEDHQPRRWLDLLARAEREGDANLGQTLIRLAERAAALDREQEVRR